jgi:uncharacterized protein YhfF
VTEQPAIEEVILKLRASGCDLDLQEPPLGSFGDGPELSASLIELVIAGKKTASTGTPQGWSVSGARLPMPGDNEITLNWDGRPVCILETIELNIVRFCDVTPEFAAAEGEGDLSLEWWRAAHERYFRREAERLGYEFSEDMPVVCQKFKVVWLAGD